MLLALAVASVVAFAVPAMAMAEDIPLHVEPTPTAASSIKGGVATLQTVGGTKVTCEEVTGSATWESSTTGHINLTFKKNCKESVFGSSCGEIKTTELQFHLLTLAGSKPGILITSNNGHFATFSCGFGLLNVTVNGNGILGTITAPACGGESTTSTIKFEQTNGVQKHKKVEGTTTEYHLESSLNGGAFEESGQTGEGVVTFEGKKKLNCT